MPRSQRRMAAREDQSELVITHRPTHFPVVARTARCACDGSDLFMKLPTARRAAQLIDCAVSCGRNDPPRRVGRDAVAPPPVACHDERFLHGVFSQRDVAEDADQRCYRLAGYLAEHTLNTGRFPMGGDGRGHASTRPVARNERTSIGWLIASTTLPAQASAASRSSALMM